MNWLSSYSKVEEKAHQERISYKIERVIKKTYVYVGNNNHSQIFISEKDEFLLDTEIHVSMNYFVKTMEHILYLSEGKVLIDNYNTSKEYGSLLNSNVDETCDTVVAPANAAVIIQQNTGRNYAVSMDLK
ncbi:hypothetical protein TrispH2_007053 [Trichoplax sp. H2]|nr:hypothetical protein TrispH2_007053 [Trichoplax sp. H2]|eukprot:RDD41394.1 hypothetical protein TrispH2_007053 [Trichoplax sp. H2]